MGGQTAGDDKQNHGIVIFCSIFWITSIERLVHLPGDSDGGVLLTARGSSLRRIRMMRGGLQILLLVMSIGRLEDEGEGTGAAFRR